MSSRTLRRRVHRPDVDGKRYGDNYEISDSLNEPLLGNRDYDDDDDDDRHSEGQAPTDLLDDERSKEHRHWALLFSHLIAQWAQWLVIGKWRCNLRTFLLRIDPIALKDLAGLLLKFHVCHDLICHNLDGSKTCLYRAFNISNHILRQNVIKYIIRTKSSRIASEKQICRSHVPNFIWSIRKSGANIVVGPWSLIGRLLPNFSGNQNAANRILPPVLLSPLQEERLEHLKQRLAVPFDGTSSEHQDALRQLWRLAYPDRQLPSLKSELWKEMGWQGSDPSTDFRGGGFISLENLIFFAKAYPEAFQNLLHKRDGDRSEWEYPFAVAGINISFMLVQMLDLQSGKPSTMAGQRFLEVLSQDEMAFDNLFCVAFKMLDAQWLVKHASYMQFNDVLKSTRAQLERELALEDVSTVRDLPAYNLLKT